MVGAKAFGSQSTDETFVAASETGFKDAITGYEKTTRRSFTLDNCNEKFVNIVLA